MGCKTSVVRSDGSVTTFTQEDHHRAASPSASPSKLKPTRISSQTTAGPTSEATQEGNSGAQEAISAGRRKSSRASLPTSPRRSSADAAATSPPPLQHPPQPTTYAQDDDPFAPPPPLLPEAAEKSDSALTAHRGSSSSDSSSDSSDGIRAGGDDGHYRSSSSSGGRQAGLTENHFDPIPMPNPAQCGSRAAEAADLHHPRLPSAESRTVSKDSTGTFRTAISDHDKTDSAQAAKEYQQRMEAKRRAEEVHTKRRRLEEFDPVRPLDSFNVTHRGLLGRCWDRRAPELIPVSFVHAIAKALGVDESHPASTTTVSHVSGGDEFPPGSPIQHPSRLSRQSGPRASSVPPGPTWTGIGGRRVPRRSHWFSVGGISTDGLNPTKTSSPTSAEPFYVSSVMSSPTVPRAPPPLVFPTNAVPILLAGGPAIRTGAMQMMIAANASVHEQAKPSPKKAATAKKDAAGGLESGSFAVKTLTPEQVSALPWETRESYYSVMLTRNPRFMGIKDHFAFKLGSGVSNDRSVKFLRKRNLEPAPGVTAMRWNRVEFFNPSLHTLVRAVAKTQGASVELQRIEAASCHTAGCNNDNNNNSTTGVAAASNEANGSVVGLYSGCGSPRNRTASAATAATAAGAVRTSPSAAALAEAERDGVVTASPEILHRSFSQCVIGEMENRSFARDNNGGGGGGGGSANGSFLNNTLNSNPIGGPPQGERSASGGRLDKAAEHGFTRGPGSFLMGLHRSQNKEVESCEGASAALTFPEDSVLALALGLPCSRLGQLAGVPAAVRNAALTSTGRLSSTFLFPAASTVGLGSRKASRDTLNSTTNGGGGGSSAAGGAAFTALRPNADSVLVSLNISCFSVSINPFEWQERHYTRYPVDIDGSKRSARSAYGEGVVTDVMYGGLMVVECSSLQAERELQALLASMAWTEERSLQGIVKDVRKHLKTVQTNLHKARAAGKTTGGATSEDTTRDWSAHRYRITRRIGGRPMRDAVELQDIRVFFSEDETMREERTTLHHPEQRRRTPVATAQSPTVPTAAKEQEGGTKTPGEERAAASHSSPNAPDPDVSSSFSRVASAWFGLPVISAVLRTWGLHLLACPEYAQPISMFLQKHAGLAPALQLTALGSFYHEGNTPSDDGDGAHDLDSFFFETDGPAYDDDKRGGAHDAHHHPQPARRIPKYNRFYASLPPSPASHQADDHPHERDGASRDGNGGRRVSAAVGDDTGSGPHDEKGRAGQRRTGSSNSRPPRKDAPTAASSPVNHKSSSTALDEMAEAEAQHGHRHQQQHHRRRPRDAAQGDKEEDRESHHSLGPKSHSKETMEGEGAMHLLESRSSTFPPPTSATAGGSQNSTGLLSASQSSGKAVGGRPQQPQTPHATKKPPPLQAASSTRSGGTPQARKTSTATRPASRCDSPLSPGRMTVPHSRRNNDERTRHGRRSLASSASSSTSSSGSSFFESSSSGKTRHNTFVYQRNNSSSTGGAASVELSSHCPSRLERETTAVLVPEDGSALSRTSATEAARHVDVPTTTDGVLSPHVRRPPLSISNNSASPNTTPLFKGGSPHLFVPSSPGISSVDTLRQDTAYELVAMAKTVGPADSVAAKEAQRRTLSRMRDGESPLPSQGAVGSGSSPLTPASRRGSNAGSRGAPGEASPLSSSQATAAPAAAGSPASASEGRREGKTKSKGTTTTKKKKKVKKSAEAAPLPPALKPSATTAEEQRTTSAATAAIAAAGTDPTSLPIAPSAGACGVKEAQIRPLGTPTGVAHASAFPPLNSSSSLATTAATTATTTASLHPAGGHHATQEEAEGLWYMTMLEVKAQQQELEDLRRARRNAEDHRQRRQDDLRSLNRVFLPHTHPQDLDCTLLYLKTVLHEPDDIPHGRLFLQQLDWLPVLAAVWTSPANRIRSVEVAAELTWMDIPRLGVVTGLLYHHNAAGPLEELILRSDKLLGAPRCGLDDATEALAKTKRRKLLRKKKLADSMELSNTSLNFVTELDRTGTGFGPGCPPFFIAPEEARDTLWLLLCAVATNTVAANFRVVLRGIPTLESTGTGGSSSGSLDHDHNNRSASNAFTNFFAARRRDDRNEERLLLKPASMLLDSFVVQPTLHTGEESGSHIRVGGGLFKAASPPPSSAKSGGGGGASAPPLQLVSRNSTFDEAGFLATAAGSIRLESPGRPTTSANTPEQPSPNTSRQPSSLVIVTSSPVGTAASPDPLGLDDGSGPYSPGRHTRRSLSTLMTLRTHAAAAGAGAGSTVGRATPPPAKAHTVTVPTHQHHVKKRPWACDSIEVEERPFYEVLTHRCRPIEEARAAAANLDDPSLLSSLYVSHYHHPFNATHNDARFFIAPARQAQLQKAVRRAAAVANGEDFPEEVDESTAVYSSKVALTGARQLHLHPPQEDDEQLREQPQSTRGTTPSSPPPPPPPPVPCPPPLLFCETSVVFGLESAEEEARVLCYEEGQLRERAADIWEALRKSVKHYNQAQQETRHKAAKAATKGASAAALPPTRLITLEY